MALRPILILPDPAAPRQRAAGRVDDALRKLMDDMVETMHDAPGIGLAAIRSACRTADRRRSRQEGRAAATALFCQSGDRLVVGGHRVYEEGCLSIPEYYEEVERPASVRVRFLDRDGAGSGNLAEGLLATALQHEIDHLDGVLFIDHISKLKRDRVTKKFIKIADVPAGGHGFARPAF